MTQKNLISRKRMGRPPLPTRTFKRHLFFVRLDSRQHAAIQEAVLRSGLSASKWARAVLAKAAQEP